MTARIVRAVVTLFTSAVASFWLVEALPGDAASTTVMTTDLSIVEARRQQLGLDRPVWERFIDWFSHFCMGDLGYSATGMPVVEQITVPLQRTATLFFAGAVVMLAVGLTSGIIAGVRSGSRTDRVTSTTAATALATPEFALAVIITAVFSSWLDWFPPVSLVPIAGSPLDRPVILVLPALTVGITVGSWMQRMVRAVVAAEANRPHVHAARNAGVHPAVVVFRHLLPGAAGPILQILAASVPGLLGAVVVAEVVYGYAGAGTLLTTLIATRDVVPVAALVFGMALATTLALTISDVITRALPQRWAR